jgi:hypothetical protein
MMNLKRIAPPSFVLATFVLIALAFAACGGDKKPASDATGASTPSGNGAGAPPAGDSSGGGAASGPTTTTTMTLGDGGDLQGAKLGSSSTQTIDTKGTSGPKPGGAAEPGRGVKDVQAIIASRRDEARACYDNALKTHPGIEGDLDVKWVIDPKGVVGDIAVDESKSTIHEPSVGKCVVAIIQKIKFAESAKGFETRTHYPFNFHPRMDQLKKDGGT